MDNRDGGNVELVRPKDFAVAQRLDQQLISFKTVTHPLPGIAGDAQREALIEQIVESIRRVRYVSVISDRKISHLRADPSSDYFDPLKAAILYKRQGYIDEAFWMVFLFVYFGKNKRTGWRLARDVYGCLGSGRRWDWARVSTDPSSFRAWLAVNEATLKGGDGVDRNFGNHRKYETFKLSSARSTAPAFESYVRWVTPPRTHQELVGSVLNQADGDPRLTFDFLYRSMKGVISFGRTARFDYLTMIGKLGLAPIEPGSTYMQGATGPMAGARLLFEDQKSSTLTLFELENLLINLETYLDVGDFGMQVLEDALCNWQKSPNKFVPFRG